MKDELKKIIYAAITDRETMILVEKNNYPDMLLQFAQLLAEAIFKGGKILICGNGGSAADSQHFAAEMIVRLSPKYERAPLPAIALTADTSVLTAIGNDYGFDHIFARQVQGLGKKGDFLIAISTSGNSTNIIKALEVAEHLGLDRIGLLGNDGGKAKELCNYSMVIPSQNIMRIQEEHIFILHLLVELTEKLLTAEV